MKRGIKYVALIISHGKIFLFFGLNFILSALSLSCAQTSKTLNLTSRQDTFIDLDHFRGDKIALHGEHSSQIKNIHLKLELPDGHKILIDAGSSLRIFFKEGRASGTFPLHDLDENFVINEKFSDDKIFAELILYYCREGERGLCLMRNVLFEITLDGALPPEDLSIHYAVPETKY